MKKILLQFTILFGFFVSSASAQVFVEQGKVEHKITPGENVTGKITVHNTSDQPIKIRVYWEDFRYEEPFDGAKKFLAAGTTDYSIAGWSQISPQGFTLAPYTKKKVNYVINVPNEIKGGYYGVLFFEKEPDAMEGSKGISIVARVGSLFFLESERRNKQSAVSHWQVVGSTLSGELKNHGDVIIIPKGIYYIIDQDGVAVDRGETEKMYLPPGKTANVTFDLDSALTAGRYNAVVTFDLNEGDVLVQELDLIKGMNNAFNIENIRN